MSPEFGSTAAMFPIDQETITYLKLTGRPTEQVALVEAYAKEQGLWHDPSREPAFSEYLELDLSTRSQEHTSELQTRQYLECSLLLGKKGHRMERLNSDHQCSSW